MRLSLAKVVSSPTVTNLRTQVRILPDMADIQEENLLPWYPPFFKDEITFTRADELVWVITNEEFSIGFILGLVSSYTWIGSYESQSIPDTLRQAIDQAYVQFRGRVLAYQNLKVVYWDENCLHFIDRTDGSFTIAFRQGTIHRVSPSAIEATAGTSSFVITDGNIRLTADRIHLSGLVRMGKNPKGKVLVAAGDFATQGSPSEYVEA